MQEKKKVSKPALLKEIDRIREENAVGTGERDLPIYVVRRSHDPNKLAIVIGVTQDGVRKTHHCGEGYCTRREYSIH